MYPEKELSLFSSSSAAGQPWSGFYLGFEIGGGGGAIVDNVAVGVGGGCRREYAPSCAKHKNRSIL